MALQIQTRESMSSSSSRIAVSVSESSRSWSPGPSSRAETRPQWCKALLMMPAKSHSARAQGFGRTARVMAALRRRRAIWISPTSAAHCDWRRCLRRTEAFEWRLDAAARPRSKPAGDKFRDFISVMRQFTIECRLCSISASCRCNGGGHAHVQGRAASRGQQRW